MHISQMEAIDSKVISHRHHDPDKEIMSIRFRKNGGPDTKVYCYGNVSAMLYKAGLEFVAPSTGEVSFGSWFQRVIKPNPKRYPYTVIHDTDEQPPAQSNFKDQLRGSVQQDTVDFASQQPIPVADAPAEEVEETPKMKAAREAYEALLAGKDADLKAVDAAYQAWRDAREEAIQEQFKQIETQLAALRPGNAPRIVISDTAMADVAMTAGIAIARMRAVLKATIRPEIDKAYRPYKALLDVFNRYDKPLEADQDQLRAALASFKREQERIAQEEQNRLRRQQEIAAEQEAKKKSEALQLDDALSAEARGETELADTIINSPALPVAPVVTAPIHVPSAMPQRAGVSHREKWEWEMLDASKLPDEFWIPDEKAITKLVEGMGARSAQVLNGAIRAYDAGTVAFSTKTPGKEGR